MPVAVEDVSFNLDELLASAAGPGFCPYVVGDVSIAKLARQLEPAVG